MSGLQGCMTLFRKKPRQRLEGVVTLDYLAPRRSPRTDVFVVGGAGVGGGSMEGARGRDNYPRCLPRPDWSTVRCFPWFYVGPWSMLFPRCARNPRRRPSRNEGGGGNSSRKASEAIRGNTCQNPPPAPIYGWLLYYLT